MGGGEVAGRKKAPKWAVCKYEETILSTSSFGDPAHAPARLCVSVCLCVCLSHFVCLCVCVSFIYFFFVVCFVLYLATAIYNQVTNSIVYFFPDFHRGDCLGRF